MATFDGTKAAVLMQVAPSIGNPCSQQWLHGEKLFSLAAYEKQKAGRTTHGRKANRLYAIGTPKAKLLTAIHPIYLQSGLPLIWEIPTKTKVCIIMLLGRRWCASCKSPHFPTDRSHAYSSTKLRHQYQLKIWRMNSDIHFESNLII